LTSKYSKETNDADLEKGREQKTEPRLPALNTANPDSRTVSSGRRLDVDAVLERSVRKVGNE